VTFVETEMVSLLLLVVFFRRPCQGDYGAAVGKFRVGYGRGEINLVQRNFFR
jgi:hypothetical protein